MEALGGAASVIAVVDIACFFAGNIVDEAERYMDSTAASPNIR